MYIIEIDGLISSEGMLSEPMEFMASRMMQIKRNVSGTEKGYIEVDKQTGWVMRLFINRSISGYITMYGVDIENDDGTIIPVNTQKNIDIEKIN